MPADFVLTPSPLGTGGSLEKAYFQEAGPFPTFGPFSATPSAALINSFSGFVGPFQFGTLRLVFVQSGSGTFPISIQAWTGPATGPLVLSDAGAQPSILHDANLPNNTSISACQDPLNQNVVYMVYWKSTGISGSSRLSVQPFDMNTGLWGTEVTSTLPANTHNFGSGTAMVALFRNVDRTIQVFTYQTFDLVHSKRQCGYASFALAGSSWSGAWTPSGDLTGTTNCIAVCGAVDSMGVCYVIYTQDFPGGLIIQSLSPLGILSSISTVSAGSSTFNGMGQLAISGATLSFVWAAPDTLTVRLATAAIPGTLWTVVSIIAPITDAGAAGISPDGSTVFAIDDTSSNIYMSISPFASNTLIGNTFANRGVLFVGGPLAVPAPQVLVYLVGKKLYPCSDKEGGESGRHSTYSPPPGTFDLPFTWVFDASTLANGSNQPNSSVYLLGGYGDFLLRRIVGMNRILAADGTGKFQVQRASKGSYIQSDPVQAPNSPELAIAPEEWYPETGKIWFDLFGINLPATAATAQIAFQGVRRQKGTINGPTYKHTEKSYTYQVAATIDAIPGSPIVAKTLIQDYDFELHQIILMVKGPSGYVPITTPVCSLSVFDKDKVSISNKPVLDIFYNGAPGTPYQNGAIVPPLYYKKETLLQINFYKLV